VKLRECSGVGAVMVTLPDDSNYWTNKNYRSVTELLSKNSEKETKPHFISLSYEYVQSSLDIIDAILESGLYESFML
jgi:hypothetical protein